METIFDIYKDLYTKQSGGSLCDRPEFQKIWNTYMMAKILRMNPETVNLALKVQLLERAGFLPKDIYLFLYARLPQKFRAPFFKFIKRPKKETENKKSKNSKTDEEGYLII